MDRADVHARVRVGRKGGELNPSVEEHIPTLDYVYFALSSGVYNHWRPFFFIWDAMGVHHRHP
jgi:hypothetical protein